MSTTVTAAEVKAYAPEFSATDDARVELFIGFAGDFVNETQFGRKFKQGIILATCHLLTMADKGSQLTVTSEKVGDLQVNYAPVANGDEWDMTSYGMSFKALKRTIKKTPLVV